MAGTDTNDTKTATIDLELDAVLDGILASDAPTDAAGQADANEQDNARSEAPADGAGGRSTPTGSATAPNATGKPAAKDPEAKPNAKTDAAKDKQSEVNAKDDGEKGGDQAADPLASWRELFGEDAVKPLESFRDEIRGEMKQVAESARRATLEAQVLREAVHAAEQAGASAGKVLARMQELGRERPGGFKTVAEMAAAAAKDVGARTPEAKPAAERQRGGGPTPPQGVPRRLATKADRDEVALDAILDGKSAAEVQRLVGSV